MVKTQIPRFVDDLTGDPAHETIEFGLDCICYEIDLSRDNAARLREILEPYILKAKKGSFWDFYPPADPDHPTIREIRQWAHAHGISLSGGIDTLIILQFQGAYRRYLAAR